MGAFLIDFEDMGSNGGCRLTFYCQTGIFRQSMRWQSCQFLYAHCCLKSFVSAVTLLKVCCHLCLHGWSLLLRAGRHWRHCCLGWIPRLARARAFSAAAADGLHLRHRSVAHLRPDALESRWAEEALAWRFSLQEAQEKSVVAAQAAAAGCLGRWEKVWAIVSVAAGSGSETLVALDWPLDHRGLLRWDEEEEVVVVFHEQHPARQAEVCRPAEPVWLLGCEASVGPIRAKG
jgi:hypothetical protein